MSRDQIYPKWFNIYWKHRKTWIYIFIGLSVIAMASLPYLKFNFSFEQFYPTEDEDLTFFQNFIEDFEGDDNFLLIGFHREPDVFEKEYLNTIDILEDSLWNLPHVLEVRSLTSLTFPRKTPFGPVPLEVLNYKDSARLADASRTLPQDPRFRGRLISASGQDLIVYIKTKDNLSMEESRELHNELDPLLNSMAPEPYHLLGRAYFQTELVAMQQYEVTKSALIASLLIALVMFWLFRRPLGIAISLISISMGLLLFFGYMSCFRHDLDVMASLFPIIMIIVGTSDVIHIMSKYIDEDRRNTSRKQALYITMKEIGLATLFTSVTTAIGFLSLIFSRISSIQTFGYNAAIGVILAYLIVIFFTTSCLSFYSSDRLSKKGNLSNWWSLKLTILYNFTLSGKHWIWAGAFLVLGISLWGISMITTNYSIRNNLPEGYKIEKDFLYFENTFGGYRPYEYALEVTDTGDILDYEKMQAIHTLEEHLRDLPEIARVNAPSEAFKAINLYAHNNDIEHYTFPKDSNTYSKYIDLLNKMGGIRNFNQLMTLDGKKARISSTIKDVGADSIAAVQSQIEKWFSPIAQEAGLAFRATGTGVIFDKNSEYVRESLIYGLGLAIGIVSLLMALLFRSFRMFLIAMVPNAVPLLCAGALIGLTGTELEAGVSIIFAVVFGIAVDDTIHFLSKYRISRNNGLDTEMAIKNTFLETGKAITLTSIILFTGFMILFFSVHPPTRTVGWLISITLLSALIADLLLIPLLIRWAKKSK